jgi:predicted TIM-barrel fold metal-dependent hydrolase
MTPGNFRKPTDRIVDSHQHVNWNRRDTDALVRDMDAHGIDHAWLLTWCLGPAEREERVEYQRFLDPALVDDDGNHPGIPLSALLAARDRHPRRFTVGYCPNPIWSNAAEMLELARDMHGIRVCGEWKYRQTLDDPRSLEIFRTAGRLGLPVVLHLDVPYLNGPGGTPVYQPRWYGGAIVHLERALQLCPETNFIGHAPGFWREISGDAGTDPSQYPEGPVRPGGRLHALLDRYPNLHADLSANSGRTALARDPHHAADFVSRYADRLLFGRDYYEQRLHAVLESLSLPTEVVEKVYWRNADRLVPGTA